MCNIYETQCMRCFNSLFKSVLVEDVKHSETVIVITTVVPRRWLNLFKVNAMLRTLALRNAKTNCCKRELTILCTPRKRCNLASYWTA